MSGQEQGLLRHKGLGVPGIKTPSKHWESRVAAFAVARQSPWQRRAEFPQSRKAVRWDISTGTVHMRLRSCQDKGWT